MDGKQQTVGESKIKFISKNGWKINNGIITVEASDGKEARNRRYYYG